MKKDYSQGFSLIELLTAMTLFVIVSVIVFDLALSLVHYQEQMVAMQSMFNDSSYAVEYMGRMLRMARKADDDSCIPLGENYINPGNDSNRIQFLDYERNCRVFSLIGGQIHEDIGENGVPITSSNHTIQNLSFAIVGDESDTQPRVTISFQVVKPDLDLSFRIQTTISQRNLNSL